MPGEGSAQHGAASGCLLSRSCLLVPVSAMLLAAPCTNLHRAAHLLHQLLHSQSHQCHTGHGAECGWQHSHAAVQGRGTLRTDHMPGQWGQAGLERWQRNVRGTEPLVHLLSLAPGVLERGTQSTWRHEPGYLCHTTCCM